MRRFEKQQVSRAKRIGTYFENQVCEFLVEKFPSVERRVMGGTNDKGDVAGLKDWVLELKNHKQIDLAGFCDEAKKESENAGSRFWAVVAKRRNRNIKDCYVIMPLGQFRDILVDLDYLDKLKMLKELDTM